MTDYQGDNDDEPPATATKKKAPPRRTVDVVPRQGQMIKAGEIIDIRGRESLSLQDQQVYNKLLNNAHGAGMSQDGREYEILTSTLRGRHKGNERLKVTIRKLMTTICVTRDATGKLRQFQLLGGNDMDDDDRPNGKLRYSFDHRLVALMKDSITYGKLELSVMMAFRSKYSLALWEFGAKRVRLTWKSNERLSLEDTRAMLGVEKGALQEFSNLKQKALAPALKEVNHLADFEISMTPLKTGRRVTHIDWRWREKSQDERDAAVAELERPSIGRKARMEGTVEAIRPEESIVVPAIEASR